jgi:hypothetical protein
MKIRQRETRTISGMHFILVKKKKKDKEYSRSFVGDVEALLPFTSDGNPKSSKYPPRRPHSPMNPLEMEWNDTRARPLSEESV